jgi:transcriptional regulator with XRE-family HTH domain
VDGVDETSRDALARAIGEELRRAREAHGWSHAQLSRQLPSENGDRTLLAYEHGVRRLLLQKLVELCVVLRVDPGTIITRGLARAQLYLENLTLHVDLNALLEDNGRGGTFGPMRQRACNTLNEHPDGIVEIEPAVVRNLASFIGCSQGPREVPRPIHARGGDPRRHQPAAVA